MGSLYYNDQSRKNNLWIEEYYSSVDTKILFNGAEFKNASYVQFSIEENIKPIFGYNSSTFDDVAIGNRLVSGIIRVPVSNLEDNYKLDFYVNIDSDKNNNDNKPGWVSNSINNKSKNDSISYNQKIKDYQSKLNSKGYDLIPNGYMDNTTKSAILKFQIENNLTLTGSFDDDTLQSINGDEEYNAVIKHDTSIKVAPKDEYPPSCNVSSGTKLKVVGKYGNYLHVRNLYINGYINASDISYT